MIILVLNAGSYFHRQHTATSSLFFLLLPLLQTQYEYIYVHLLWRFWIKKTQSIESSTVPPQFSCKTLIIIAMSSINNKVSITNHANIPINFTFKIVYILSSVMCHIPLHRNSSSNLWAIRYINNKYSEFLLLFFFFCTRDFHFHFTIFNASAIVSIEIPCMWIVFFLLLGREIPLTHTK